MSKLRQPVFEKPEEPDFIKRLKQCQTEESSMAERPMTDAPICEDELPTVANDINDEDFEKLRELHGLEKRPSLSADTPSDKSRSTKKDTVGLGSRNDLKQRRRLEELKTKRDALRHSKDAPSHSSLSKHVEGKAEPRKRKKMKMSFD